jgi:hypothetical protein
MTNLTREADFEYTKNLLTLYAESFHTHEASRSMRASRPAEIGRPNDFSPKIMAHVENFGDIASGPDGWAGRRGSGLAIEGFAIELDLPSAGFHISP